MKNDDEILANLIAGGLIGVALGALLSENDAERTTIGAIAGAAILATYKANEQAQKTNVPVLVEQNGKLYEIQPGGNKRFVKDLEKPKNKVPQYFKLK